jgi:fatty acid desaturase
MRETPRDAPELPREESRFVRHPNTTGINAVLICIVIGGTLFQLFGLPFALRLWGIRAACLLLPIALLQPLHWGLIHEAIHSHLLIDRRTEEFVARLLSVMHWLPYDATRYCHLVHHRFSRHAYDRADEYNGRGSYALAWLRYRLWLCGGLYWAILFSPLVAFLPEYYRARVMANAVPIREAGDGKIRRLFVSLAMNAAKRRRTCSEFGLTVVVYGASVWVYGEWWPMLLAAMSARGLWHSIADNLAHHDVALDEPERARDHTVPGWFGTLLLNQHLHLTHHRWPRVPWKILPKMIDSGETRRPESYFRAAFRQFEHRYPRLAA